MKKNKFAFDHFKLKQQLAQIEFNQINDLAYDGNEGIISQIEKHGVIVPYSSLKQIKTLDEIITILEKEKGPTQLPPQ